MPITAASLFDRVVIGCSCQEVLLNGAAVFNGGWDAEHLVGSLPGFASWDLTDTEVAEVISRVEAGTCAVYMREYSDIWLEEDTPDIYAAMRLKHPFHPDGGWKIPNQLTLHGDYLEDGDTGQPSIDFGGNVRATEHTPTGAGIPYDMERWLIYSSHEADGRFRMRLTVDSSEALSADGLDTYGPILALRAWLNSVKRSADADVAADASDLASFENRLWSLALSAGNTITYDVHGIAILLDPSDNVLYYVIDFDTESGTYDIDAIAGAIEAHTGLMPTAGQVVPARIEVVEGTVVMDHLDFGHNRRFRAVNGLPEMDWSDPGSQLIRRMYMTSGYGRAVAHTQCPVHGGAVHRTPRPHELPFANLIHFAGLTAPATFRLDDPQRVVGLTGVDRTLIFHNTSAHNVTFQDWDGATFFMLKTGERMPVRWTWDDDGAGEMVATLPERRMLASVGDSGVASDLPYYRFDASAWIRPLFVPAEADFEVFDTDAFTIGTAVHPALGTQFDAANAAAGPQSFELDLDNEELHYIHETELVANGGGSLTGIRTKLARRRGATLDYLDDDPVEPLVNDAESRILRWEYLGSGVDRGDVLYPMFQYSGASSLSTANCEVASVRISARLKPTATKPYTP